MKIESLKVTSINCRGASLRNPAILKVFRDTDVLLCQEVKLGGDDARVNKEVKQLEKILKAKIYISKIVSNVRIITIIKDNLQSKENNFREVTLGRVTYLHLRGKDYNYTIYNVYGPVKGAMDPYINFCKDLFNSTDKNDHCLLLGDWNLLLNDSMCSKQIHEQHRRKSREVGHHFKEWIDIHDIIKQNFNFTYVNIPKKYKSRLDRIYIKEADLQKVLNYKITPCPFSDHDIIEITMKWGDRPKWGKGTWAMNTQVLDDPDFELELTSLIKWHINNHRADNDDKAWDALKAEIKKLAIKTSQRLAVPKKCELDNLKKEFNKLREIIEKDEDSEDQAERYEEVKHEIESKEREMEEGNRIRAKIDKFNNNEQPTKYFFKQEKKSGETKQINTLINGNNDTLEQKNDILKEIENFYTELYKTENFNAKQAVEYLKADTQMPESDNLVFEVGTMQKRLYGADFKRAKTSETKPELLLLLYHIDKINTFKKSHKYFKSKDLQGIIYPKEKITYFKEIYQADEPKLISINYLMLHGLLSFRGNTKCYLCKKYEESLDHLLFHCPFLTRCRELVRGWLEQLGVQDFNKHNIIEMSGVPPGIVNYFISIYKDIIWKNRNIAQLRDVSEVPIYNTLEDSASFYIKFIFKP